MDEAMRRVHMEPVNSRAQVGAFGDLPILVKLLAAFGMVLGICTIVSGYGLWHGYALLQRLEGSGDAGAMMALRPDLMAGLATFFWSVIASLGCGAVLVPLVSYFIKNAVVRPIELARDSAQFIANGDLSRPIQVHNMDETGQLLQVMGLMQQNLCNVITAVRQR